MDRIFPMEVALNGCGLEKPSKILSNQIRTMDKERLVHKIGRVDAETMEKVNEALKISLGLD